MSSDHSGCYKTEQALFNERGQNGHPHSPSSDRALSTNGHQTHSLWVRALCFKHRACVPGIHLSLLPESLKMCLFPSHILGWLSLKNKANQESRNDKWWWECGYIGILPHCWWEWKMVQPLWGKQDSGSSKCRQRVTVGPRNNFIVRWIKPIYAYKNLSPEFTAKLLTIAKKGKQPSGH